MPVSFQDTVIAQGRSPILVSRHPRPSPTPANRAPASCLRMGVLQAFHVNGVTHCGASREHRVFRVHPRASAPPSFSWPSDTQGVDRLVLISVPPCLSVFGHEPMEDQVPADVLS